MWLKISVLHHSSRPKRQTLCWRVLQDLNLYHLPAYLPLAIINSSIHIILSLICSISTYGTSKIHVLLLCGEFKLGPHCNGLPYKYIKLPVKTLYIRFGEVKFTHLGQEILVI